MGAAALTLQGSVNSHENSPGSLIRPSPDYAHSRWRRSDEGRVGNRARESADGRMASRRSLKTTISNISSHPAASDNGEGVSNLWSRERSSDKEPIRLKRRENTLQIMGVRNTRRGSG